MKLVAVYKGTRHEIGKPAIKDFVLLERLYKIGAQQIEADPRMEYMLFLAFAALRRQGVVEASAKGFGAAAMAALEGDFEAFLEDIEDLEDEDADAEGAEVDDVDPTGATQAAPTA